MTESQTSEKAALDAGTKSALKQLLDESSTNPATQKNKDNAAAMMFALDRIREKRVQFDAGIKVSANSVLYELLDDVFETSVTFYVAATKSAKVAAIAVMKNELKSRGIETKENARVLPMMIQLTFGVDDRRSNRYAQVISKAIAAEITPGHLAAYITKAGGIENVIAPDAAGSKKPKGITAEQIKKEIEKLEDKQYFKLSTPYEDLQGSFLKGKNAVLLATKKPDGKFGITAFIDEVTEDKCPIYTSFMGNLARISLKAKAESAQQIAVQSHPTSKESKQAKETA